MMIMLIMICDDYDHDDGEDANLDDDQDNDDDDDVRKGNDYFAPLLPTSSLSRLASAATSNLF